MDRKLKKQNATEQRQKRLASALKVNIQKRREQAEARQIDAKKDLNPTSPPSVKTQV